MQLSQGEPQHGQRDVQVRAAVGGQGRGSLGGELEVALSVA